MKKFFNSHLSLRKAVLCASAFTMLSLGTAQNAAAWHIVTQFSYVDEGGCIQIGTVRSFLGFEWTTWDSPNC